MCFYGPVETHIDLSVTLQLYNNCRPWEHNILERWAFIKDQIIVLL